MVKAFRRGRSPKPQEEVSYCTGAPKQGARQKGSLQDSPATQVSITESHIHSFLYLVDFTRVWAFCHYSQLKILWIYIKILLKLHTHDALVHASMNESYSVENTNNSSTSSGPGRRVSPSMYPSRRGYGDATQDWWVQWLYFRIQLPLFPRLACVNTTGLNLVTLHPQTRRWNPCYWTDNFNVISVYRLSIEGQGFKSSNRI